MPRREDSWALAKSSAIHFAAIVVGDAIHNGK
jgi:hypothetical protein